MIKAVDSLSRRTILKLIKAYQFFLSPLFPPACRFHPTCSDYAIEALQTFPAHRAMYLIAKRIIKCNPLFEGGIDHVRK